MVNEMRENGIEVNLAKTKNVKLAEQTVGLESGASIFQMGDAPSVEELAKDKAREEFNNQVDEYVDKLNQHQELLDKYKEEVIGDLNKLEIAPLYEGILIMTNAEKALNSAKGALTALKESSIDVAGTELEGVMPSLGELDGRQVGIEIVDDIFSRFCVA